MSRNPRNTAIFIFAFFEHSFNITDSEYHKNLLAIIDQFQHLGFEPYIVTYMKDLLTDCNLFILLDPESIPMERTKEFWKEYNYMILDNARFDMNDLILMLHCEKDKALFVTGKRYFLGTYFHDKLDDTDWIEWHRQMAKKNIQEINDSMIIIPKSEWIESSCPTST